MMTQAERLRRRYRAKIHVRKRLRVEYVGGVKERLICPDCGWEKVQNLGNAPEWKARHLAPDLVEKLCRYRGHNGVSGDCDRCTKRKRDAEYPKGWKPF